MNRALLILLLALLLAGCGTAAPPASAAAVARSLPTALDVPAIDAKSSLALLGLNADRTVEVTPVDQPQQAGSYEYDPTPTRSGPRCSSATSTAPTGRASSGGCTS